MAQKKAHEVDGWLKKPDPGIAVVLVYGPDRGLVSERASAFAASTGLSPDDPFAVLKLDGQEIVGDAGRLLDELRSIPMFGGRRLVWLRNAPSGRDLADIVAALDREPPVDALLLVEAADLKKGSALRSAFENAVNAMALPCYGDDDRAVDRMLDEALEQAGMAMTIDARQMFKSMLGGDRLATRAEIEKLVLYCHGRDRIEPDDIAASAGDVSAQSLDAVVDAVLAGEAARFDRAYTRAMAAGAGPFPVLAAMIRQMQALQLMRHRMESGREPAGVVVQAARPPVFFTRRALVTTALSAWNGRAIARALRRLQQAVLESRTSATLSQPACHRILLSLCLESARLARG